MAIPVIPSRPITNITPFTYKDGYTYLRLLEKFRDVINQVIENNNDLDAKIDQTLADINASFAVIEAEINAMMETLAQEQAETIEVANEARTEIGQKVAASIALIDAEVAAAIATFEHAVDNIAQVNLSTGSDWGVANEIVNGELVITFTVPENDPTWWANGGIGNNDNLNTYIYPGIYRLSTATGVQNLPPLDLSVSTVVSGMLRVENTLQTGATWAVQEFTRYGAGYERWWRVMRNSSGTWNPWVKVTKGEEWDKGALPEGSDFNTITQPGVYQIERQSLADTMLNAPSPRRAGFLEVFSAPNGLFFQRYNTYGSALAMWIRSSASVTSGTWTGWTRVGASGGGIVEVSADAGMYSRDDLVGRFRQRRGGSIGLNGRPAVALRFDHHLDDFVSKVLPLLVKYNLPWAQMLNPERMGSGDDNYTLADVQAMALHTGGEIFNHGGNHGDVSDESELVTQIVESLTTLQTNLPALAIEGWAPPGLGEGGYLGASPFKTHEQLTDTVAGQLIMANHAVVAGYADGRYRPMVNLNPIGAPHYTMDSARTDQVMVHLNGIRSRSEGVALMLHANYLDQEDYMSTETLEEVFAEIALRRDAGTLEVISYSGLWCADGRNGYRHSIDSGIEDRALVANVGQTLSVSLNECVHYLGAIRHARLYVEATTPTELTIKIPGATREHVVDVPAGNRYVSVPFAIDKRSALFEISVTSTQNCTIGSFDLRAI